MEDGVADCRGSCTNGPVGTGWGKPAWNGTKKACQADALFFVRSELYTAALPQEVVFFVHSDSEQSNDCDFDIPWNRRGVQHFLVQLLFSYRV